MKLKNYAYRCMAVVCAIVAVACVDENFSLDKVSKEVSVIDGETILPLGSLEKQTLGSLLGSDTDLPEGLVKNSDGSYEFTYVLDTTTIPAPEFELPTEFAIEAMETNFSIDLPTLDFTSYGTEVKESFDLNFDASAIEAVVQQYATEDDSYTIPEYIFNAIPEGNRNFTFKIEKESIEIDAIEFELPEQIKNISRILFDGNSEGIEGAPLSVQLDLNSFAGVNAGGHFNFTMKSKANLVICNHDGEEIEPQIEGEYNVYPINSTINEGDESVGFLVYIVAIENEEAVNKTVSVDPSMEFEIDFALNIQAGTLSLTNKKLNMPVVDVFSEFALKDAEVIFDSSVDLVSFEFGGESGSEGFDITIDSLPEQIKGIECVELSKDSKLVLYATNLEWLGDTVSLDLEMPACLVIKEGEGYTYNTETNLLTTTIEAISSENGLNVLFDKIDLSILEKDENGAFSVELNPSGRVHFTDESPIRITEFITEGNIEVAVGIKDSSLGFESVTAQLDFSETIEEDIDLSDLASEELPIDIGGSGLSPVLMVTVANPLTIDANIEAQLIPYVGEEAQVDTQIKFNATIAKAVYDELTGETVPTTTTIVLAKESQRANYPASEGYTFVDWDIDNLIRTPLPDKIALSATVGLPTDPITLHFGDISSLEFSYGASFSLPFAFDNQLSISYEMKESILDNGKSPFAEVAAIEGIKVGDIALIAEFETTLPLELEVTTTLYDKAGNELPTKIGFTEGSNVVKGSKDGDTPENSTLRLQFDLAAEDGSLAELADVAEIGFKIEARGSAADGCVAALKEAQYIAAELKLEIDGGITVDLDKL